MLTFMNFFFVVFFLGNKKTNKNNWPPSILLKIILFMQDKRIIGLSHINQNSHFYGNLNNLLIEMHRYESPFQIPIILRIRQTTTTTISRTEKYTQIQEKEKKCNSFVHTIIFIYTCALLFTL